MRIVLNAKKKTNKKCVLVEIELTNRNHLILCLLETLGFGDKSALVNQMIQDYLQKNYSMLKDIDLFNKSLKDWDSLANI